MNRLKNRENRSIARHHRQVRTTILEMHSKTQRARLWDAEFEAWTKTEEYGKEQERIRELVRQTEEEMA